MGFKAVQYAMSIPGLKAEQQSILFRAAYSCMDDTAFLGWNQARLASYAGMGFRTFERHLAALQKLNLLVWNGEGFRLSEFFARQNDRQNGGKNGGAYKEGFELIGMEEKRDEDTSSPQTPLLLEPEPPPLPVEPPAEVTCEAMADSEVQRLTTATAKQYSLSPEIARSVVVLGLLRSQGKQRIRSPEYFRSIVDDLLKQPLPRFYPEYLECKLEELRGVSVRSP